MKKKAVCQMPNFEPGSRSNPPHSLLSLVTDLHHVNLGRPLFLFPAGVYVIATLGIAFRAILVMCPIQRHLLLLIATDSGAVLVLW